MEDAKKSTDDNMTHYGGIIKSELLRDNTGAIDVNKIRGLHSSDFSDLDRVIINNANFSNIENAAGRRLSPDEKRRITAFTKSKNIEDLGVIPGITTMAKETVRNAEGVETRNVIKSESQFMGLGDNRAFDQVEELGNKIAPLIASVKQAINNDTKQPMFKSKYVNLLKPGEEKKDTDWSKNIFTTDLYKAVDYATTMQSNSTVFNEKEDEGIKKIIKQNPDLISNVEIINTGKDLRLKLTVNGDGAGYKEIERMGLTDIVEDINKPNGGIILTVPRDRAESLGFMKKMGNNSTIEDINRTGRAEFKMINSPDQFVSVDKNSNISSNKEVYIPNIIEGRFINVERINPQDINTKLNAIRPDTFNPNTISILPKEAGGEARKQFDFGAELKTLLDMIPKEQLATMMTNGYIDITKIKDGKLINNIKSIFPKYGVNLPLSSSSNKIYQ
jgi:hypothetical protein